MANNAAGLDVSGSKNPRWKGGLIAKTCAVCAAQYSVKPANSNSRYCSLKCVGISQRGRLSDPVKLRRTQKDCEICSMPFSIPTCHAARHHCCSRACSYVRRSTKSKGASNPSWSGGLSRFPYPWNFREISKAVIERDGNLCQNPMCAGTDKRLTTHHINYEKQDCRMENLICLCSACNSKANFGRNSWRAFYQNIIAIKKDGGGWKVEEF